MIKEMNMTNDRTKQWELAIKACDRFPLEAQNLVEALERNVSDEDLLLYVRAVNQRSIKAIRQILRRR